MMPSNLALKSSSALRTTVGDLATLVPALPRTRGELVAGGGTWVGTGICDLRASVASQQKQLDSLIDKVALLLSSMHSEVLQDLRCAVATPEFEARLAEMRKVGEVLDERLAELRAEAAQVPEGVRMLHVELQRVEEKMNCLDDRFSYLAIWRSSAMRGLELKIPRSFRQDFEKTQNLVTESLMSVHDRFTTELEGVITELKKLETRLGSAETDLGLLSDDDLEMNLKQAILQQAEVLRSEFPKFLAPYFDQTATRINALEDHLQREHNDLLVALQQAAAATGVQEGDRALQRDLAKRTKEDLRQQSEELSALTRQMSDMKIWQSSAMEEAKVLRLEVKQREEDTFGRVLPLEERMASIITRMCQLEEQVKTDSTEKRLSALEDLLQGLEENMKNVEPLQRLDVRPKEDRLLTALEKVDLAVQDLKRQLETQITELVQRDETQAQRAEVRRDLEQRLLDVNSKTQHLLADQREDFDARLAQVQRQGDELRRELELKIEKRNSSTETSLEDLKHQLEILSAQQQSVSKKQGDDLRQLSAELEIRMVKEQSAVQRSSLELRTDLERGAQEAVNLCSEVLREEQAQLVREFRQELERRLSQAPTPILVEGLEEIQELREELQELKEGMEAPRPRGDVSPNTDANRLLRSVEETVSEKVRRCDAAAELCERLARRMEWQLNPEDTRAGSGVPGEQNAYEGMILQREGPWSLYESKGRYSFDDTSGWLSTAGSKVGQFICRRLQPFPLALEDVALERRLSVKIITSDLVAEMQKVENQGALFMVCSQLNGAAYPSPETLVHHVEDYKHQHSSGAEGQLAAHPAAAQFLLDNAANVERVGGINALDLLLSRVEGFQVTNGYLKFLPTKPAEEAENLKNLQKELHNLRSVIMEDVSVKGLRPDRSLAGRDHRVGLFYASSLEGDGEYQMKVAELLLTAQYYGALRYAAESSPSPQRRRKVFLTPLGGFHGVHWELGGSMAKAMRMLDEDAWSRLSVSCLVGDAAAASELRGLLQPTGSTSPKASKVPRELFRPSDDSSDGDFRPSPIQESSTESRISVLMRRVDHQASELQSLREKNEELSEAVDQ